MDVFDESFQQRIVVTERFDISRRVGIVVAVAPAILFLTMLFSVVLGVSTADVPEVPAWQTNNTADAQAIVDNVLGGSVLGSVSATGAGWLAVLLVSAVCFVLGISDRSRSSLWGMLWAGSIIVMAATVGFAQSELQTFADAVDRTSA